MIHDIYCSALEVSNNIAAAIIGRVQNNYYYLIPSTIEMIILNILQEEF